MITFNKIVHDSNIFYHSIFHLSVISYCLYDNIILILCQYKKYVHVKLLIIVYVNSICINKHFLRHYLKLNKKSNWIKSCFQTCDKESIYLGKQVLNSRLDEKELRKVLKK